jgi:hypothetical protein
MMAIPTAIKTQGTIQLKMPTLETALPMKFAHNNRQTLHLTDVHDNNLRKVQQKLLAETWKRNIDFIKILEVKGSTVISMRKKTTQTHAVMQTLENRLRICPVGVVSKNDIGATKTYTAIDEKLGYEHHTPQRHTRPNNRLCSVVEASSVATLKK